MTATKITHQQRGRISHRSQGKRRSLAQQFLLELLLVLVRIAAWLAFVIAVSLAFQLYLHHGF